MKRTATILPRMPYTPPTVMEAWSIQGRTLLESFSLETDFEDFEDGGDLI